MGGSRGEPRSYLGKANVHPYHKHVPFIETNITDPDRMIVLENINDF